MNAQPPNAEFSHAVRKSVLEKTPRIWRVGTDALHVEINGASYDLPWDRITELRLRYEPGRYTSNRFMAQVRTNGLGQFDIDNQHWAGVAEFHDRSDTYRLMIELLLQRLRAKNPKARLITGSNSLWATMIVVAIGLIFLFFVVLAIGGPIIAIIKLVIIAFFIPRSIRYILVNKQRSMNITDDPPDNVLPSIFDATPAPLRSGG